MGRVFVRDRDIVIPGEILAEGDFTPREGAIKVGNRIISTVVGLVYVENRTIKVVPLEGEYYWPRPNDYVIGKIVDFTATAWLVDIRAPYYARLELSQYLEKPEKVDRIRTLEEHLRIGDVIYAKILYADRLTNPILTMKEVKKNKRKLEGGTLVYITPKRVGRVLGKNQSMLKMLADISKAEILVGANGVIWVKARNKEVEKLVVEAIKKIERESFTQRLTERVRKFLEEKLKEIGE